MANTDTKLVSSKIVYDRRRKKIQVALLLEVGTRKVGKEIDHMVLDLETTKKTKLGGLWPVDTKVKLIVKMIAKLDGGALNKLRRELAVAALRENNLIPDYAQR